MSLSRLVLIGLLLLVAAGVMLSYGGQAASSRQAMASVASGPMMVSARASDVRGRPSLSAAFIDRVLARYTSPAVGSGWALYSLSLRYGIDDAYALGFFWNESHFGLEGEARVTHSLGNLRCVPDAACIDQDRGGYAAFPDWNTGFAAWYKLLAGSLYIGAGLTTLEAIIPRYAPAADHNWEQAYIAVVKSVVARLHAGSLEVA